MQIVHAPIYKVDIPGATSPARGENLTTQGLAPGPARKHSRCRIKTISRPLIRASPSARRANAVHFIRGRHHGDRSNQKAAEMRRVQDMPDPEHEEGNVTTNGLLSRNISPMSARPNERQMARPMIGAFGGCTTMRKYMMHEKTNKMVEEGSPAQFL